MEDNQPTCPKCSGVMEQGWIKDAMPMMDVAHWHRGAPQRGLLGGVKSLAGISFPIAAFRCQECGFLEQYARREHEPK